jgi:hypothetical protein
MDRIYGPYSDGRREVWADPVAVHRRLSSALDGEPSTYLGAFHVNEEARGKVLAAAVTAIQLHAFDPATGAGLREDEVELELRRFLEWSEKNGSRGSSSRTSRQPTGCPGCPRTR